MEFWPDDNQIPAQSKTKRNGKGKGKISVTGPSYLESGRLEAATLVENHSKIEWTFPLLDSNGPKLIGGPSRQVLEPTRPPVVSIPPSSIAKRAEHGANFLRSYFPDVELSAGLVKEELTVDAQTARALEQFNPFSGNVLQLLHINASMHLAFPIGVTGCDLSISPFVSLTVNPSLKPVKSFLTPIQQLATSQLSGPVSFLAVRTFSSIELLSVASDNSISELASIVQDNPVDVKFQSRQAELLFVNEDGAVYKYGLENGRTKLSFTGTKNPDPGDKFWQLALAGNSEDGCLLTSSKLVQELDFRTSDLALNLLTIATNEKITCIEDSGEDYLIRLASTERLLWLDRRFPGRPLFGIKHRRNYDRTLTVHTLTNLHSLLTSRKNGLVTVYDVSRSADQLLHLDKHPYAFSFHTPESRSLGETYMNTGNHFQMFRISERGRISCIDLLYSDASNLTGGPTSPIEGVDSQELRPDLGPLGAREFSETNLRPAYEQLFPSVEAIVAQEEEEAEAVYNLFEEIPTFWQKVDTPVDQALTTYDILFRAGEEPRNASRADFLTQTVFNSTRGYRLASQNHLPTERLKNDAPWHYDVTPIMGHFDKSTVGDIHAISERLRDFDLASNPDFPVQASRRQKMAREQLGLDLTLSKDVFSPKSFSRSSQALGVDTEASASPVHFHYLQPTQKHDYYSKEESREDNNVNLPLGVRLLLDDWEVGADPEEFVFHEPYGVDADTNDLGSRTRRQKAPAYSQATPPPPSSPPPTQTQLPPSIAVLPLVPVTFVPPRVLGVESQLTQSEEVESQGLMTSTQVLPGPYGGRPTAVGKKKQAKKRVGGF